MKHGKDGITKRIRFHGRGGQGMKTASRIVGTASFIEGYFAQDCSVYGAERRGAPMMAFTRFSKEPILERGIIVSPDINIIADETLLSDHTANVFQGTYDETITMVNTHYPVSHVRETYGIAGEGVTIDVTGLVLKIIGKPILSSAAAASACKLTGMITKSSLEEAVVKELTEIGLKKDVIKKNVQAAFMCYDRTPDVYSHYSKSVKEDDKNKIVSIEYANPSLGSPSIYARGNTILKKTGNWRLYKPVINHEKCSQCYMCYISCPHSCIYIDDSEYPQINYDNCKGCLVCYYECPKKIISKEREVRSW